MSEVMAMELAAALDEIDRLKRVTSDRIRDAVNCSCSCGGRADDKACPACRVWSLLEAQGVVKP